MPELAHTFRHRLRERADDQYGFITTRDAAELGVPPVEVRKIAARGGLTRVGHGVYHFDDVRRTGREPYMEAVLLAGNGAFLTGEAVLALHELAQVNPRRLTVGTPRHVRTRLPKHIEVHERKIDEGDLTSYEGIPTTTVARAIIDARPTVMRERLIDAIDKATTNGLLLRADRERVLKAMRGRS